MIDGYLQPKVNYTIDDSSPERRRVTFQVEAGPHYDKVVLAFDGASGIDPDELDAIVDSQGLERQLFTDPIVVTELLARYYRDQGYLSAEIDEPRIEYQGSLARVVLAVREGPKFTVRRVAVSGNKVVSTETMLPQLPVISSEPFLPSAAEQALDKIRTLYWPLGYNDLRSDYSLVVDRIAGQVDVTFTIAEGTQSVVGDIQVRGNRRIDEKLVRDQLVVEPGQPLDLSALAKSRRNLYDTGAFSVVRIDQGGPDEDRDADAAGGNAGGGSNGGPQAGDAAPQPESDLPNGQKAVPLNVVIREVQPLQLKYGASYDTERGLGGILDVSQHNWLGGARVIGLQARYDKQLKDGRIYINQPALASLPISTTGSIYFREDLSPPSEITRAFNANRKGASIQQEVKLLDSYVWSWGYRYEHARAYQPVGDVVLIGEPLTVSPLTTTLTRETRDDALDATRGQFLSQAFSFSPGWLGSDEPYMKYFGQYLPLLRTAAAQEKTVHERDPPPAARLCHRRAHRAGQEHRRRHGAGQRALLLRRQQLASRLRAELGWPDRPGPGSHRRQCDDRLQQRAAGAALQRDRRGRLCRHRQRLPADQRHLPRSPPVRRRRPARAHAVVPAARRLRRRARPASGRAAGPLLLQHRPGLLT